MKLSQRVIPKSFHCVCSDFQEASQVTSEIAHNSDNTTLSLGNLKFGPLQNWQQMNFVDVLVFQQNSLALFTHLQSYTPGLWLYVLVCTGTERYVPVCSSTYASILCTGTQFGEFLPGSTYSLMIQVHTGMYLHRQSSKST